MGVAMHRSLDSAQRRLSFIQPTSHDVGERDAVNEHYVDSFILFGQYRLHFCGHMKDMLKRVLAHLI